MLSTEISTLILEKKEKYYHDLSMKLNDPKTSAKHIVQSSNLSIMIVKYP